MTEAIEATAELVGKTHDLGRSSSEQIERGLRLTKGSERDRVKAALIRRGGLGRSFGDIERHGA